MFRSMLELVSLCALWAYIQGWKCSSLWQNSGFW